MKIQIATLLIAGLLASCVQPTSTTSKPSGAKAATESAGQPAKTARLDEKLYDHFGDGVAKGLEPITLVAATANAKTHSGKKIRLTGKIQSVCQKKGCWMVLAEGSTKVRVKFRDYGFFMPLDSQGREAILDGTFSLNEVSIAEIKHLLEDAGKHAEAEKVDKPRQEFTVVADGVALKK